MIVLVVNCGSSSLKYQLVNMDNEEVMAKGLVEKIGLSDSLLTHKWNGQKKEVQQSIPDHQVAVKMVLDILTDAECGVIKSMDAIDAVGHRVVHGGEEFASSTVINDEVMKALEKWYGKAPVFEPLPKFAEEKRDLALVMDKEITCGQVEECIKAASPFVKDVTLFDVYEGKQILANKKSMAFTVLFTPKDEAFTAEAVDGYVKKILKQLNKTYGIELRS